MLGPALGGLVIARCGVGWVYALNAVSFLVVIAALLVMRDVPGAPAAERGRHQPGAGARGPALRVPRAAHPLDHAARLLRHVLRLGHRAAADLRAGHPARRRPAATACSPPRPSVGACSPAWRWCGCSTASTGAGARCSWSVVGYGLATVVFGLSRSFWLTFVCLALTGATDTVSMVIRNVIRQLNTPDAHARAHDRREHDLLHGRAAARRAGGRARGAGWSARCSRW